jgi:excisionase family DNA binding protein
MSRSRARTLRIRQYRDELIAEIGLLSIGEAARALRRRKAFVVKLIETGQLRCVQWGTRQRRIRVADLEQFLAQITDYSLPAVDPRLKHRAPRRPTAVKIDREAWDALS